MADATRPVDLTPFAGHTPGSWQWRISLRSRSARIETPHSGRLFVMLFDRWGMQGAQPVFGVWDNAKPRGYGNSGWMRPAEVLATNPDHNGEAQLLHPDALLMAAAPDLLAEVEASRSILHDALPALRQASWDLTSQEGRDLAKQVLRRAEIALGEVPADASDAGRAAR